MGIILSDLITCEPPFAFSYWFLRHERRSLILRFGCSLNLEEQSITRRERKLMPRFCHCWLCPVHNLQQLIYTVYVLVAQICSSIRGCLLCRNEQESYYPIRRGQYRAIFKPPLLCFWEVNNTQQCKYRGACMQVSVRPAHPFILTRYGMCKNWQKDSSGRVVRCIGLLVADTCT
jgi:hypothetical protein